MITKTRNLTPAMGPYQLTASFGDQVGSGFKELVWFNASNVSGGNITFDLFLKDSSGGSFYLIKAYQLGATKWYSAPNNVNEKWTWDNTYSVWVRTYTGNLDIVITTRDVEQKHIKL